MHSICTILHDQKWNVAGAETKSRLSLGASRFWASYTVYIFFLLRTRRFGSVTEWHNSLHKHAGSWWRLSYWQKLSVLLNIVRCPYCLFGDLDIDFALRFRAFCLGLADATKCCATRVMSLQLDFQEQRSLVQETIEMWDISAFSSRNTTVS